MPCYCDLCCESARSQSDRRRFMQGWYQLHSLCGHWRDWSQGEAVRAEIGLPTTSQSSQWHVSSFLHVHHVHHKHAVTGNIWLGSELEGSEQGVACSHLSNAGCCWAVNVGRLPAKPQRLISVSTPVKHKDGTCQCGGFVQLFKVNFVSPGLSNKKQCNLLLFAVEWLLARHR